MGFAEVAFLNADGDTIARLAGATSVPDFENLADAAERYLALEKKAAAGDDSAKIDLLIAHLELARIPLAEVRYRLPFLPKPSPEQQARIDVLSNEEVLAIMKSVDRDKAETRIAAGKRLLEMHRSGRIPAELHRSWGYWSFIIDYAESIGDGSVFEEAFGHLKEKFRGFANLQGHIQEIEKRLTRLRE